jgi:hypothetical protein
MAARLGNYATIQIRSHYAAMSNRPAMKVAWSLMLRPSMWECPETGVAQAAVEAAVGIEPTLGISVARSVTSGVE